MDRLRELRDAGKIEWIEEMTAWAESMAVVTPAMTPHLPAHGIERPPSVPTNLVH